MRGVTACVDTFGTYLVFNVRIRRSAQARDAAECGLGTKEADRPNLEARRRKEENRSTWAKEERQVLGGEPTRPHRITRGRRGDEGRGCEAECDVMRCDAMRCDAMRDAMGKDTPQDMHRDITRHETRRDRITW
ncbi:hypothetical protein LY78DRAFT_665062 [Colletotrichum sublineola]|nr:hypothetical protein LY78DRAFT_665062 [Colletotrichum sublineola]